MTSRSYKQTPTLPQFTQYLAASALRLTGSSIRSLKSFHGVPPSLRSTIHQFIPALSPHYSHRSRPSQCCDKSAQPSSRRPIVNGQHSNHLLDVRSRLSRGLQEDETVLFRKLGSLLRRHGTTMLDIEYDSYRWFRSDLLPISMITMFEDPFSRASVNHLVSCVNVSRRVISYTSSAPAAPR